MESGCSTVLIVRAIWSWILRGDVLLALSRRTADWWAVGVNSYSPLYSQHVVSPLQFPGASSQRDRRRMCQVYDQIFDPRRTPGDCPQNKRGKDNASTLSRPVFFFFFCGGLSSRMRSVKDAESLAVPSADALCMRSARHWLSRANVTPRRAARCARCFTHKH